MWAALCLLVLCDALFHAALLWLLWRIAAGDLTAQHPFKRVFQFVGLEKLPPVESEFPKF